MFHLQVCLIVWMMIIVYKSGIVNRMVKLSAASGYTGLFTLVEQFLRQNMTGNSEGGDVPTWSLVQHDEAHVWQKQYYDHWPTLFGFYNISLLGRYVTILPTVRLSNVISPDEAIRLRHPADENSWTESQRNAGVLIDEDGHADGETGASDDIAWPYVKTSLDDDFDMAMSVVFVFVSVIILSYVILSLYPYVCPRRYDKWRHSKLKLGRHRRGSLHPGLLQDSAVTVFTGHLQVHIYLRTFIIRVLRVQCELPVVGVL